MHRFAYICPACNARIGLNKVPFGGYSHAPFSCPVCGELVETPRAAHAVLGGFASILIAGMLCHWFGLRGFTGAIIALLGALALMLALGAIEGIIDILRNPKLVRTKPDQPLVNIRNESLSLRDKLR
jgi:hypothetical protein